MYQRQCVVQPSIKLVPFRQHTPLSSRNFAFSGAALETEMLKNCRVSAEKLEISNTRATQMALRCAPLSFLGER